MYCEADPLAPLEGGELTVTSIPGATLTTVPGVGHGLAEGASVTIIDAIDDNAPLRAPVVPASARFVKARFQQPIVGFLLIAGHCRSAATECRANVDDALVATIRRQAAEEAARTAGAGAPASWARHHRG